MRYRTFAAINKKVSAIAPGYDIRALLVTIIRGKIIELNISLTAQVISLFAIA